jgi:hypothetical protein
VCCLIITWYVIKRKWSPWSGIGLEKNMKKKKEEEEDEENDDDDADSAAADDNDDDDDNDNNNNNNNNNLTGRLHGNFFFFEIYWQAKLINYTGPIF